MTLPRGLDVVPVPPTGCELFDLHNHTAASYDASNTYEDYERAHAAGLFHVLGVTDHNNIDGALDFASRHTFKTIVGEEVDTADGELIGLFLNAPLELGRSAIETAEAIREQGGLVYVQHPFYRLIRRPLSKSAMDELGWRGLVDIVEGINGGPFMWLTDPHARAWAKGRKFCGGAGSDAHHPRDIGRCVVALPPGEFSAAAVKSRLEHAVLVDRRQRSLVTLAARLRYAATVALPTHVGIGERKFRTPPIAGGALSDAPSIDRDGAS